MSDQTDTTPAEQFADAPNPETNPTDGDTPVADTTPAEQFADDAFSADDVDDFGSADEFTGTLPGEQAPSTSAPTSNLDSLLEGVDMSDPLAAFEPGKKVKFTGNVIGVKEWKDPKAPGRVALIIDIMPTSPPQCVALGKLGEFCEVQGSGAPEGLAKLRALAKAAGVPPNKPSMLAGKVVSGAMSKGKKGDKMFLNF